MASDVKRRDALGKLVCQLLRNQDVEYIFPAKLAGGQRHVVVGLQTDTYGELLERVSELSGPVNVVIGGTSQAFHVIVFTPHKRGRKGENVDECEIGSTSEIGLLLELLRNTKRATKISLASPNYDTELVDLEQLTFG